ncbi:MAG: metalloregulator ArsR/SmtB family transcription factor [Planctomycetota bacterium]|nr:metalloregulator ArsR/SmtB family transcription factor [Planctomycetota bacterium]
MARKKENKPLSPAALGLVAARFKLLGEPARLALLNSLMSREQNVNELVESTSLSQANVSKHLSQLADAGYVNRRKDGLFTVYSISDDSVFQLCDLMCSSIAKKLGQDLQAIA